MEMLPFDNRDGLIWMNGEFIAWNDAKCHVINQGMHYASSVFEGERAYKGKIFKSEEHTKRLFKSANTLGMDMPFTEKQINEAKDELINKMKLQDCYVRPIVWRGSKQMGLSTSNSDINVAIAAWDDWASYFKIEDRKAGLRLITSPLEKTLHQTLLLAKPKASGPYVICTMSKSFAEQKGYHDALMLDYRGYVAEGTGANIFFIKDNDIHTPIPDCFLNGITRQTVIEMLSSQGFNIIERHIMPDEISNYDEAFLTGTAAEITPLQSIDEVKFKTGDGTKNFKFMQDYHNLVRS
jgi:branched-chain amino acid aminotransferase